MKDEHIVYVVKDRLVKTVGVGYKSVLKDLKDAGVINSYSDAVELRFDKDKALHIQSVLEFYDSREVGSSPIQTHTKKEE
jgi:hypothetical protein